MVLTVVILLNAYAGGDQPTFDLGLVGASSRAVGSEVVRQAEAIDVVVRVRDLEDEAAARPALNAGEVDAVLIDGTTLLGQTSVPDELTQVVQTTAVRERIRSSLADAGVPAEEIDAVLNQPSIAVRTVEPTDPERDTNAGIAFIAAVLAYAQLVGYGVWVATGVIEEKASRVVEVLLSAIRPHQLLGGKIAGIGALGIAQLTVIATFAIVLALATGAIDLPGTAVGSALIVLAWFVMGFAFYSGLFAVAGSLVSRVEELQNALVPLNLTLFVSFFVSIGALESPDSPLAVVASIVPFSSPFAMPVRVVLGAASPVEIAASVVALLGGTAALVPLSARLYAGAILRTGTRVKLKDAWRSTARA